MGHVPLSGRTAVRQTLRSGHSAQRLFSMRHLKAIRALAPLAPLIIDGPAGNRHPERKDAPEPVSWPGAGGQRPTMWIFW